MKALSAPLRVRRIPVHSAECMRRRSDIALVRSRGHPSWSVIQGTHAASAGGIAGHLQPASERQSSLGIDRLFQCELMCIADGRMEEAGAHTPIHFDYGRDPWSVAYRSLWRRTVNALSKTSSNFS